MSPSSHGSGRPWPPPPTPWLLGQTWDEMLLAHWRVPAASVRPLVPGVLEVEEFDGSAWVGLLPFRVTRSHLRRMGFLPLLPGFFQLNCRTYVRRGDRPGVWFFSLDASSRFAVAGGRRLYGLPYRRAGFKAGPQGFSVAAEGGVFLARYQAHEGTATASEPGTLEHFVSERYCLYSRGGTMRAEIDHQPWQLERIEAKVVHSGIAPLALKGEPICHVAARQEAVIWPPTSLDG